MRRKRTMVGVVGDVRGRTGACWRRRRVQRGCSRRRRCCRQWVEKEAYPFPPRCNGMPSSVVVVVVVVCVPCSLSLPPSSGRRRQWVGWFETGGAYLSLLVALVVISGGWRGGGGVTARWAFPLC